jgi:phosphatidate cytidylyltransferase
MGLAVLLPTAIALVYLRKLDGGEGLILLLILVVATADVGGYFVGRAFGKHKLALAVSPGKTWEGAAGGMVANLALVALLSYCFALDAVLLACVIIPTSMVSVLGDLLESMLKRHAGYKDSGRVLPGHGGVLDRVDGITAAAPIFALALLSTGLLPSIGLVS